MKERKANRIKGYDYSLDNLFFVTSCVENMTCCFGEIGDKNSGAKNPKQMDLNEY